MVCSNVRRIETPTEFWCFLGLLNFFRRCCIESKFLRTRLDTAKFNTLEGEPTGKIIDPRFERRLAKEYLFLKEYHFLYPRKSFILALP